MKTLKVYVRNKARPKSNMVEGYTIKDVLGFYTKYLLDFITTKQNMWDDKENPCMFEVVEGNGCP